VLILLTAPSLRVALLGAADTTGRVKRGLTSHPAVEMKLKVMDKESSRIECKTGRG